MDREDKIYICKAMSPRTHGTPPRSATESVVQARLVKISSQVYTF